MNLIQATVEAALPPKRKSTTGGWISFNAVCCHHNGERPDTRKRGGIMFSGDGFVYSCFNCGFKAGWQPGKMISKNSKSFFQWLGISDDDINKLIIEALKEKDALPQVKPIANFDLKEVSLPDECLPINTWISEGAQDPELLDVISYLVDERKVNWDWYNWHWSAAQGYRDRVILPFYQDGKIVGWSGRKIRDGKPKYLASTQPGYVFNIDNQTEERQYVIVVEGQFDAIAVAGVAIMHNEISSIQAQRINRLQKKVIVVPDRDRPGAKLIQSALEHNWSISIPPWETDVKDVADAVKRYGRIYTLTTILHYQETNKIKIELAKKKLEHVNT